MKDGIGAGRTREDHADLARQLYASCARVARARALESIIGRDELSEVERQYLHFGEAFERKFLTQGPDETRSVTRTLDLAWDTLGSLPDRELTHLPTELLGRFRQSLTAPAGRPAGAPA
jgi:V/A-type H+-transporting ATPase subunit B